jgi:hypothetical protein
VNFGLLYSQSQLLSAYYSPGWALVPLETVSTVLGARALGETWSPLEPVSTALGTTVLGWALASSAASLHCSRHYSPE